MDSPATHINYSFHWCAPQAEQKQNKAKKYISQEETKNQPDGKSESYDVPTSEATRIFIEEVEAWSNKPITIISTPE